MKTIEEQAKEYANSNFKHCSYALSVDPTDYMARFEGFLAGATYALELAAERAKVLVIDEWNETEEDHEYYRFCYSPFICTKTKVSKQSILELIPKNEQHKPNHP